MKTDSKARYQGYKFYFREGLCWNNVLNPKARLLKVKLKQASVNDVGSMSLLPSLQITTSKYLIGLLNSNLIFDYYREFVNCTVNIQINDLRQIPIVVPTSEALSQITSLVNKAIYIKKAIMTNVNIDLLNKEELFNIERQIDEKIHILYHI